MGVKLPPLPGNCLLGAIALTIAFRGRCSWKFLWLGHTPHFVVRRPDGVAWHFTTRVDLLPGPFAALLFLGVFEPRRETLKRLRLRRRLERSA